MFHASGALDPSNRVTAIVEASEFFDGGSGKKLKLTVTYQQPNERPEAALPERLFVKFSRHFDNDLWDSAKWMMLSEVNLALLSRSAEFPVMVPLLLFADLEASSETGLLITELIPYGEGNVEPAHAKCMDYLIPDAVEHYRAIFRSLGRLSGAHRAGTLAPEFDVDFPDAEEGSAQFRIPVSDEISVKRAHRMFDFTQRYPKLFPEHLKIPLYASSSLTTCPTSSPPATVSMRFSKAAVLTSLHLGTGTATSTTVGSNEIPTVSFIAASSIGPTVERCHSRRSSSVRSAVPNHPFGPTTSMSCWASLFQSSRLKEARR